MLRPGFKIKHAAVDERETKGMSSSILERVLQRDSLPSQPTVALQVLQISQDANNAVDELIRIIQTDPSMTARVLKVVNSSYFGASRRISSLKQAVVALGLRSVRMMAISMSLADAMRQKHKRGESADDAFSEARFWRRSLTTAIAARKFSVLMAPRLAEEAFVSGLLADIGMAAAWHSAQDIYRAVLIEWRRRKAPLVEVERQRLGVTHADLSAELLRKWRLPENIAAAAGAHHGVFAQLDGEAAELSAIVRGAAWVADLASGDSAAEQIEAAAKWIDQTLGISERALHEMLRELNKQVDEIAATFSVAVAPPVDLAELVLMAGEQLAEMTLEADKERSESLTRERETSAALSRAERQKLELERTAHTDRLTGVANRAAFDQAILEACENSDLVSLILLDLDGLKQVNDKLGHLAGDALLSAVGQTLNSVAAAAGKVARYGGDEFAVVLARRTAEEASRIADELRGRLESLQVEHRGEIVRSTGSLGVASIKPASESAPAKTLIDAADKAMYRAKANGRNRVVVASPARRSNSLFGRMREVFGADAC